MNCNKCPTDVLIKPLPVQKLIYLLMRPFNHPENKGNTSLHLSLSHTIVLIIFIKSITLNILTKAYVLVFHFFYCANRDLSMTSLRMTLHCMTSRCCVLSLLRLCEKDCSFNMLNFNKLRFMVYEIFDNSQLFLTDPRNKLVYPPELSRIAGFCTNSNKNFLGEDPETPLSSRIVWGFIITIIQQII